MEIATVNKIYPVDKVECGSLLEKKGPASMNFFGASGYLNIVDARMRGPHEQVSVKVKQLNSSDEEAENGEADVASISKHGSLSRGNRPNQRLRNRKNNKDFRSVWYDEDDEVEDVVPSMTSEKVPSLKGSLRKASSLGNLLEIDRRDRVRPLLTKNMISSPLCPRKIQGNWTEGKEETEPPQLTQVQRVSGEIADAPVDDVETRISEADPLDRDTIRYEYRKALSFEDLLSLNPADFRTNRKGSLDVAISRMATTIPEDDLELQPLSINIEPKKSEESELSDDVPTQKVVVVEQRVLKKGPSLESLFKFSTLDNRNKKKNIVKLDISAPIQPRKIEGSDVVLLESMDTEGVTNLLKMRSKSKSTNVS